MEGYQTGGGILDAGGDIPDAGDGIPNASGVPDRGKVTTLTSHQSEILHSLILFISMPTIHRLVEVVLELRCSMLETLGYGSQTCRSSAGAQVLHAGDFRLRFTDL